MTDGGVDRSVECTGSVQAMISAFECVHDVNLLDPVDVLLLLDTTMEKLRFL